VGQDRLELVTIESMAGFDQRVDIRARPVIVLAVEGHIRQPSAFNPPFQLAGEKNIAAEADSGGIPVLALPQQQSTRRQLCSWLTDEPPADLCAAESVHALRVVDI